jgi:methyl-accepting chemotaxis protein PixJ
MTVTYNPYLVVFSALIAVAASYSALNLASLMPVVQGFDRKILLFIGAIAMGIGIWSMHFIAMLAFSIPILINYDFVLVVVSLLAAILASGLALFIVSLPIVTTPALLLGGTAMGIGVALMHYIGMAAMQMSATVHYNPALFILSLAIAIVASIVALMLFLKCRNKTAVALYRWKIMSSLIMSVAILALHYTGMAAAMFKPDSQK